MLEVEISLIDDPKIREATRMMILINERVLKRLPSSRSGKYHPPDERGEGGMVLHLKRCVKWMLEFIREFPSLVRHKDALISATLLHDIGLCYKEDESEKEHRRHPDIGARETNDGFKEMGVPFLKRRRIVKYIREHMSHWYKNEPSSFESRMVALADYVASRKWVLTPTL